MTTAGSQDIQDLIRAAVAASVGKATHSLRSDLRKLHDGRGEIPSDRAREAILIAERHALPMVEGLVSDFENIIREHGDFGCNRDSWGSHAGGSARGAVNNLFFELNRHFPTHAMISIPGQKPLSNLIQSAQSEVGNSLGDYVQGKIRQLAARPLPQTAARARKEQRFTVFFAWQMDSDVKLNRWFIEGAIKDAIRAVRREGVANELKLEPAATCDAVEAAALNPEPEPDEPDIILQWGAQGAAGAVLIAETILERIAESNMFIADVSFVAGIVTKDGRNKQLPNSNVLIETGAASRFLGWDRIVLILNTAAGSIEDLPFDLKHRRCMTYELRSTDDVDKRKKRKQLAEAITEQIRAIYSKKAPSSKVLDVTELVRKSVRDNRISITVSNDLFGDPAYGQPKKLRVEYLEDGERLARDVNENEQLRIEPPPGKRLTVARAFYGVASALSDLTAS